MTTIDKADQAELTSLASEVLGRHCDLDYLRRQLNDKAAHSSSMWKRLADVGLIGALVPEEFGGAGLAPGYLAGALEVMGRYALPEPFLETAVIAVPTLAAFPGEVSELWLRRIVTGNAVATVRMSWFGPYLPYAEDADILLDFAADGTVTLHDRASLRIEDAGSIDALRPLAEVSLTGTGKVLGTSKDITDLARRLALAGAACLLAGVGRGLLETTVEYVSVRHQFGRPVGSFQAVKHKAATVAIGVTMARSAALSALECAEDPTFLRGVTAAKAYAGQAAEVANVEALQLHGGVGFTWEHHLHMWMKRAMSLGASYGTARTLRRWLARDLLDQLGRSTPV
jgi:alkylation response protein AidB-like acyl-CoA dehydrogenase